MYQTTRKDGVKYLITKCGCGRWTLEDKITILNNEYYEHLEQVTWRKSRKGWYYTP